MPIPTGCRFCFLGHNYCCYEELKVNASVLSLNLTDEIKPILENYLFKEEKSIYMSKGIAIQTILMLLLGVLVVAVVIYLVYTYIMSPILPETQCRALATTWCTSCKNVGWTDTGPDASTDLQNCGGTYWTAATWDDCSATATATFCSQCCAIA